MLFTDPYSKTSRWLNQHRRNAWHKVAGLTSSFSINRAAAPIMSFPAALGVHPGPIKGSLASQGLPVILGICQLVLAALSTPAMA
jgi:hypothetical protein